MDTSAEEVESDQIDLSGVTLEDLASFSDASLASATDRLRQQVDRPISSVGGYNS
jgi:hypothetical protein